MLENNRTEIADEDERVVPRFALSCTASILIDEKPDKLFYRYSDLNYLNEFLKDIEAIKILTPGEVGLGTRFIHSRRLFGIQVSQEVSITLWEPPSLFVASFKVLGIPVDTFHRITKCGDRSKVTFTLKAFPKKLSWIFAVPLFLILSGAIRGGIVRELEDLARDIKSESGGCHLSGAEVPK